MITVPHVQLMDSVMLLTLANALLDMLAMTALFHYALIEIVPI
jgi:hypothetical protein